jgi:hypothetical protein
MVRRGAVDLAGGLSRRAAETQRALLERLERRADWRCTDERDRRPFAELDGEIDSS